MGVEADRVDVEERYGGLLSMKTDLLQQAGVSGRSDEDDETVRF